MALYYESVADSLVPELRGRPLSLVRCPAGPEEGCFYQKHIDAAFAPEIERVPIRERAGEGIYAAANSIGAVIALVQRGVIEMHVWGATTLDLAKPDRLVLDLDPDPELAWRDVMAATHRTHEFLGDLGLEAFLKTSGGKGLHLVVPLARRHDWDEVKDFSRAVAEWLANDDPALFTAKMAKRERARRIFIDYLRNAPGATTVAAYSVRARSGAPVSTPLHWDELGGRMKPQSFHIGNIARRLQGLHSDPWKALRRTAQNITAAMRKRVGLAPA